MTVAAGLAYRLRVVARGVRIPGPFRGGIGAWRCVAVAAAAVTVGGYWPILIHPDSATLLAPGDLTSTARDYWAAGFLHETPFTLVRDRLLDVPVGRPDAPAVQIANAVQPAFALALHQVTGFLGALNLYLLAGVAASLLSMLWLLRSLRFHPLACIAGAVAFASSQWSMEQLLYGHVAFAQLWVFPLLLGSLLWACRRGVARAVAPGVVLGLSFYVSSYLGLIASIMAAVFLVALVWERRRRADAARLAIGAATALVALVPALLAPMIAPSSRLNLPPTSTGLVRARLADFLVPSSHDALYGAAVRSSYGRHVGEHVLFFGYSVLVLAAAAAVALLARRLRLSLVLRFATCGVPAGWFLSLPAHETVAGKSLTLPDAQYLIGGLVSWWRIYPRIAVLAGFGLVILAAAALDALLRSGRRSLVVGAALLAALAVAEASPGLPAPTVRVNADPVTRWLRGHPGGAVASYPMQLGTRGQSAFGSYFWASYYGQIFHHHPFFDIPATGIVPSYDGVVPLLADDPGNPGTPALLRAEGVRWVVVHPDVYRAMGQPAPVPAEGLRPVATPAHARIYEVTARPADVPGTVQANEAVLAHRIGYGDPKLTFASGFYSREKFGRYRSARWLKDVGVVDVQPAVTLPYLRYRLTIDAFSNSVARRLQVSQSGRPIASFFVPTHEVQLSLLLRLSHSPTELELRASPPAQLLPPAGPRITSIYIESFQIALDGVAISAR